MVFFFYHKIIIFLQLILPSNFCKFFFFFYSCTLLFNLCKFCKHLHESVSNSFLTYFNLLSYTHYDFPKPVLKDYATIAELEILFSILFVI